MVFGVFQKTIILYSIRKPLTWVIRKLKNSKVTEISNFFGVWNLGNLRFPKIFQKLLVAFENRHLNWVSPSLAEPHRGVLEKPKFLWKTGNFNEIRKNSVSDKHKFYLLSLRCNKRFWYLVLFSRLQNSKF